MKILLLSIAIVIAFSGLTPPLPQSTNSTITVTSTSDSIRLEFFATLHGSENWIHDTFTTPHKFDSVKGPFVLFLSTKSNDAQLYGLMKDVHGRFRVTGTGKAMTFFSIRPDRSGGVHVCASATEQAP